MVGARLPTEADQGCDRSAWEWRKWLPFCANIRCSGFRKFGLMRTKDQNIGAAFKVRQDGVFSASAQPPLVQRPQGKSWFFTLEALRPWRHW